MLQEQIAEIAIGILEDGQHRKTYSICAKNMKFKEFYRLIIEALGQDTDQQGLEHEIAN